MAGVNTRRSRPYMLLRDSKHAPAGAVFVADEAPPGAVPCDGRRIPLQNEYLFSKLHFVYGGSREEWFFCIPDITLPDEGGPEPQAVA